MSNNNIPTTRSEMPITVIDIKNSIPMKREENANIKKNRPISIDNTPDIFKILRIVNGFDSIFPFDSLSLIKPIMSPAIAQKGKFEKITIITKIKKDVNDILTSTFSISLATGKIFFMLIKFLLYLEETDLIAKVFFLPFTATSLKS